MLEQDAPHLGSQAAHVRHAPLCVPQSAPRRNVTTLLLVLVLACTPACTLAVWDNGDFWPYERSRIQAIDSAALAPVSVVYLELTLLRVRLTRTLLDPVDYCVDIGALSRRHADRPAILETEILAERSGTVAMPRSQREVQIVPAGRIAEYCRATDPSSQTTSREQSRLLVCLDQQNGALWVCESHDPGVALRVGLPDQPKVCTDVLGRVAVTPLALAIDVVCLPVYPVILVLMLTGVIHVRHLPSDNLPSDNAPDTAHVRHLQSEDPADRDASSCRLTDLVGQARAVSALQVAVLAARRESRPLPHVLLSGPPGVGKTMLARALANEMGAQLSTIAAPLLDDVPKMVAMLVSLEPGQVMFDEVHALPRPVAEVLYEALENRRLPLPLVCGTQRRTLVVGLSPFTCIGATTDEGALPESLRARFPLRESLALLANCEVAESLRRAAATWGIPLADTAADALAKAAHGTPREGLALLGRARDEMLVSGESMIDEACAIRALERAGIDARGLGPVERQIMELMSDGRSHSLAQIAAHVSLPTSTVSRVHEPKLLRLGLIRIGPWGRMAGKGLREVASAEQFAAP